MILKIGDKVKIINAGSVFSNSEDEARELGAIKWQFNRGRNSGHLINGLEGEIINNINGIVLFRCNKDGYDYVFNEDSGLEIIEEFKDVIKPFGIVNFCKENYV